MKPLAHLDEYLEAMYMNKENWEAFFKYAAWMHNEMLNALFLEPEVKKRLK